MRNVAPRSGTEILTTKLKVIQVKIEKCSSPIGDGNFINLIFDCKHIIEKCSSPIGDGNLIIRMELTNIIEIIEKCSSPIGDGN